MTVFPSDPDSDKYEDAILQVLCPFTSFMGTVTSVVEDLGEDSHAFTVEVSAHICSQRHFSTTLSMFSSHCIVLVLTVIAL